MKKAFSFFLALVLLVFVGCSKEPKNAPSTSTDPSSTTEKNEPLSYDVYFSEIRQYEIIPMNIEKSRYIIDNNHWILPSNEVKKGYEGTQKYKGKYYDGEYKENGLFLEDRTDLYRNGVVKTSPFCTDYDIYCDNVDSFSKYPYFCTDDGVYAVVNRTEIILLNVNGKKVKTVCTAEKNIEAFTVREELLWFLSDGTIYRVYLPDGKTDKIVDGIDVSAFVCFYAPISNYEIQWMEHADEENISRYFNAKTGEKKSKTQKIIDYNKLESINDIPTSEVRCDNTGWWFIPDDAYDSLRRVEYSLPNGIIDYARNNVVLNDMFMDQLTVDVMKKHDIDVMFSCGGAIKLFADEWSKEVGWISINYDYKPVFKDKALSDIKGIPSWYKLDDFKQLKDENGISTNMNVLVANGEYLLYGMDAVAQGDSIYGKYLPYRFAFICQDKNKPVYCFMLRSDLYDEDTFIQVLNSIKFDN